MPRFHTPRLSNRTGAVNASGSRRKGSRFRPRKTAGPRCKANQAKLLMQGLLGKTCIPSSPLFVFDTQPLAKPPACMLLHGSVGVTDRTQAEVGSPTINLPVERRYQRCRILLGLTPAGHLADRLTQTLHSFLGWSGAPIGPPRLRRVASTKRIPEKIELVFRQVTDPRLSFRSPSTSAATSCSASSPVPHRLRPDSRSRDLG
jgi:hypothetical protein